MTREAVRSHAKYYRYVAKFVRPEKATFQQLQEIVLRRKAEGKVHNLIKFIRVFYGKFLGYEWARTFKIPKDNGYTIKTIPTKQQLKLFYNALPNERAKNCFLNVGKLRSED